MPRNRHAKGFRNRRPGEDLELSFAELVGSLPCHFGPFTGFGEGFGIDIVIFWGSDNRGDFQRQVMPPGAGR
jgi:hypothetical protein